MSDTQTPASPTEVLPEPLVLHSRRPRLSLVWLVPLLAVAIGLSLMVRNWLETGPRVELEFRTAEGLEPGKTEVRYKEVVVGRVHKVRLREDRQRVLATVQLERSAAGLAVEDTSFWVVRPRIGVGGVSGLGTLLSGAYIGVDAGRSTAPRTEFVGLEAPPYVLRGEPGASFVLKAADLGSLDVGSPVLYRRAQVGRVVGYTLDHLKDELLVKIFIEAPYQRMVNANSRFWNASGVDLTLDANGLTLNTQTVATVLAGGIAFETLPGAGAGETAAPGTRFSLSATRKAAMAPPDGAPVAVRMVFEGSMRGLGLGAPIDFLGVEVGQVVQTQLQYEPQGHRFPVHVLAEIYPQRLGAVHQALQVKAADKLKADMALLQRLVDGGLRAQLRTGNLLTGQLYVALDFQPKAARAQLQAKDGVITLPTVPGALSELQAQVGDLMQRLAKLPLEEIGRNLADALKQAGGTMAALTPEAQGTLAEARKVLGTAQGLIERLEPGTDKTLTELQRTLASARSALERLDRQWLDERAPVQRQMEEALAEFRRAVQSVRSLSDSLQRHPESLLRGLPADPAVPALPKANP